MRAHKLVLAFVAAFALAAPVVAQETPTPTELAAELEAVKAQLAQTIEANKSFEDGMKQDAAKIAALQADLATAETALAAADEASAAKIAAVEAERDEALAEAAVQAELLGYAEASLKARESELQMVMTTGSALAQSEAELTEQLAAMAGWVDPAFNICTPIRPQARPKPQVAKAKVKSKNTTSPAPAKGPLVDEECNCEIRLKEGDKYVDFQPAP